ncbi:PAS domain-containing protein [Pseudokordiimonas caeni]|uniref:PAS domain-containing protein n=1 Tax=Pseudokordiimonas caeni TaxID=2997908 RepID=UPI0028123AC5|nr:PAS domain-containing protein [Pseudokordiimonas caeni]
MEIVRRAPEDIFDHFLSAWHAWPKAPESGVPYRAALNPMRHKDYIPFVNLCDYEGDGCVRLRLVGTANVEFLGNDPTGTSTADQIVVEDPQVKLHRKVVSNIFEHSCGVHVVRRVPNQFSREWIYETLSLPLANREGASNIAMIAAQIRTTDGKPHEYLPGSFRLDESRICSVDYIDLGTGAPPPEIVPARSEDAA